MGGGHKHNGSWPSATLAGLLIDRTSLTVFCLNFQTHGMLNTKKDKEIKMAFPVREPPLYYIIFISNSFVDNKIFISTMPCGHLFISPIFPTNIFISKKNYKPPSILMVAPLLDEDFRSILTNIISCATQVCCDRKLFLLFLFVLCSHFNVLLVLVFQMAIVARVLVTRWHGTLMACQRAQGHL